MIRKQDALGAVGNVFFADAFHLVSQEDNRDPSLISGDLPRLAHDLQGQPVLAMITVVPKDPDL